MREKPFLYKIVDEKETPDLAERLTENIAKEYDNYKTDHKRIQVRKETQEYYDEMNADQRSELLEKHPDIKAQMTIEEITLFITTGEIPEELLGYFK